MKVLLRYVDIDNIPEYLGGALRLRCVVFQLLGIRVRLTVLAHRFTGKSKGSLIDDEGPWKDPTILALVEAGTHLNTLFKHGLLWPLKFPCAPVFLADCPISLVPRADIARREQGATSGDEQDGGVLTGDSMDFERASASTPMGPPSPLHQQNVDATAGERGRGPRSSADQSARRPSLSSLVDSPFAGPSAGVTPQQPFSTPLS